MWLGLRFRHYSNLFVFSCKISGYLKDFFLLDTIFMKVLKNDSLKIFLIK